jgi:hypothetical protein
MGKVQLTQAFLGLQPVKKILPILTIFPGAAFFQDKKRVIGFKHCQISG